jgi:hypothetical protein
MFKFEILGLATALACAPIGLFDLEDLLQIGTEP